MLVKFHSDGYPHTFQGASRGLCPLVLLTGETFEIIRNHADKHDAAVHSVVIVEAVHQHVEYDLPPRQHHPEAISGFTVGNDPVLPGGAGQGECFCGPLWIVP